MDAAGHIRFAFNTSNRNWRETEWKMYLQKVAGLWGREPNFAGYLFDDSFGIGPVQKFGGGNGPAEERFISYSADDIRSYGKQPPRNPRMRDGMSGPRPGPAGGKSGRTTPFDSSARWIRSLIT